MPTTPSPASPTQDPDLEATVPGFLPPPPPRPLDPLDPEKTTLSSLPDDQGGGSGFEDDAAARESPETTGFSRASTDPLGVIHADPDAYRELFDTALGFGGLLVHKRLAPGQNPLWLIDEEDSEQISAPLSRIAARHIRLADGPASDVSDAIHAALGVAGYALKNYGRQAEMAGAFQQQEQNNAAGSRPVETL